MSVACGWLLGGCSSAGGGAAGGGRTGEGVGAGGAGVRAGVGESCDAGGAWGSQKRRRRGELGRGKGKVRASQSLQPPCVGQNQWVGHIFPCGRKKSNKHS